MKTSFWTFLLISGILHFGLVSLSLLKRSPRKLAVFSPIDVIATGVSRTQGSMKRDSAKNPVEKNPLSEASSSESLQGAQSYFSEIYEKISSNVDYPIVLQRRGIGGTMQIELSIGATGQLIRAEILKSSGEAELDTYGLNCIRKAAPFSPPPHGQEVSVLIPLEFKKP